MEKVNSYFMIGTIGMITTASLEILLAAFFSEEVVRTTSSVLYPVFITFLLTGTAIMIRRKRDFSD